MTNTPTDEQLFVMGQYGCNVFDLSDRIIELEEENNRLRSLVEEMSKPEETVHVIYVET